MISNSSTYSTHSIRIGSETLELLPEKAIWWMRKKTLVLSDIHLGKAGHFRKSGLAAPVQINRNNLDRLDQLLQRFHPTRLLLLGDLFHSTRNREWLEFTTWRDQYPHLTLTLITGNHDLLPPQAYHEARIGTHPELYEGPFHFLHDATELPTTNSFANPSTNPHANQSSNQPANQSSNPFTLSGHIHPGIRLRGKGRQSIRIPCFWHRPNGILLPAFGTFTGLHTIRPAPGDHVYAIADQSVLPILPIQHS